MICSDVVGWLWSVVRLFLGRYGVCVLGKSYRVTSVGVETVS